MKTFYRYKIEAFEVDNSIVGVIAAESMEQAVKSLNDYYDVRTILCLRQISDSDCLEFPLDKEYVIDNIEDEYVW